MTCTSHIMPENGRFSTACVFRLVEKGRVEIIAFVHVNEIFAIGLKSRCDVFRDELNRMFTVKNLGKLRWYGSCHFTREREMGILTITQKNVCR